VDSPVAPVTKAPVLIEQTGKDLKSAQAVGVILMVVGALAIVSGTHLLGAIMGFAGLVVYAYGRLGAWWQHG
jgi:hypothetical protein